PHTTRRARRARSPPRAASLRRRARARLATRASPRRRGSPPGRSLAGCGCGLPPGDEDLAEELVLAQVDDEAPVQVEQRDERDDREADRRRGTEERSEAHLRLRRDELLDLRGALLDGVALGRRDDVLVPLACREREHAREGGRERVDLTAARWQLDRAALAMER